MLLAALSRVLPRRGWGWGVIVLSVLGLWLTSTYAMGRWLERTLLSVPPALSGERIGAIRNDAKARAGMAVVVLGAGMEPFAPEYGTSNLGEHSLQRLRYGEDFNGL